MKNIKNNIRELARVLENYPWERVNIVIKFSDGRVFKVEATKSAAIEFLEFVAAMKDILIQKANTDTLGIDIEVAPKVHDTQDNDLVLERFTELMGRITGSVVNALEEAQKSRINEADAYTYF